MELFSPAEDGGKEVGEVMRKKNPIEEAERTNEVTDEAKRSATCALVMSIVGLIVVILVNLDKILPFLN